MANVILRYPFDITGKLAANAVKHQVTLGSGSINRAFAFPTGPFFVDTTRIVSANNPLERWDIGVHWEPIFLHSKLSKMSGGQEICLGIVVKSSLVPTDIVVTAQIVGSGFASDVSVIEEAITALALDDRTVEFSELMDLPETYAAAPSYRDMGDLFGMEYLIAVMSKLLDAVGASGSTQLEVIKSLFDDLREGYLVALNTHATTEGNVHKLNIHQIDGLTEVEIKALIATVTHQIEDTISSINDLSNADGQINSRIDALVLSLQSINTAMSVVNNNYQKMVLIVAGLQSDVAALMKLVQQLQQQIALMRNELNDTNARIDSMQNNAGNLSSEIAAVRVIAVNANNTANTATTNLGAHLTADDPHANYLHKAKGGTVNASVRVTGNIDSANDVRAEN